MKLYVAGIQFEQPDDSDHFQKVQIIIDNLQQINQDAETSLGEEVKVLVILEEYAITPKAISNADKKICLNLLNIALQKYENIVLIPGSLLAFQALSKSNQKENRILENYDTLLKKSDICISDLSFMYNYRNTVDKR